MGRIYVAEVVYKSGRITYEVCKGRHYKGVTEVPEEILYSTLIESIAWSWARGHVNRISDSEQYSRGVIYVQG